MPGYDGELNGATIRPDNQAAKNVPLDE
jgi:hypothetical protein